MAAVRRGQYRVTGHRHQGADLPITLGQHFFGQRRHRQFSAVLRAPGHAALPAVEMAAAGGRHQVHRWAGAERAADAVQVAGHQVDQLHQPMAQRTERLGRDAHAAITDSLVSAGEIPGQLANLLGRHRTLAAHGLGIEAGNGLAHFVQAFHRQMAIACQPFGEQSVEHPKQQRRIAAGAYEHVLVRDGCRLAAPRVDHHHFTAPRLDGLEAFFHVGHGHDAAIGGQRVAAEDQHEIGLVDVGDGQQQAVAVHQVTGEVMR